MKREQYNYWSFSIGERRDGLILEFEAWINLGIAEHVQVPVFQTNYSCGCFDYHPMPQIKK